LQFLADFGTYAGEHRYVRRQKAAVVASGKKTAAIVPSGKNLLAQGAN
jgi:hypothetical protein